MSVSYKIASPRHRRVPPRCAWSRASFTTSRKAMVADGSLVLKMTLGHSAVTTLAMRAAVKAKIPLGG